MNAARKTCLVVGLALGVATGFFWPTVVAPPSRRAGNPVETASSTGATAAIPAFAKPTVEPVVRSIVAASAEPSPAAPRVRVHGSLRVPVGWREIGELCFLPEDGTRQGIEKHEIRFRDLVRLGPGEYQWDAGELVPGDYEVLLRGCKWVQSSSLSAEPVQELRFVAPEPCDVELLVVDADSRRLIPIASETFECFTGECAREPGKEREYRCVRYVHPDESANPRFQCLPGWVSIRADLSDHRVWPFEFEARAGQQRVVIPADRICGFHVVWKVREEAVQGGRIDVRRRNGESAATWIESRTSDNNGEITYRMRCRVDEPGDYAITVYPPDGFDVTTNGVRYATVTAGKWTPVEVQLQRVR